MDYHYKAFISYRHAELDTKVATEIQNRLERYRIPGSIRKSSGLKTIGRIFRDKDELPSTSDLNDNIKDAIASSEYLICICSPRYIESVWCRKEIEFFLEDHDKSHVLTVLAEGDPYKVVPEILCRETVTTQDENGGEVTVEVPLEPLSCDYRLDRHRARTEELPRLASVLIGCRYAELRQKLRRRQLQMTGLAVAAAVVLAAYFLWSYMNIRSNYRQSLINQSEFLASAAQNALDDNDNLLAAQLSLAALPGEGGDRPVVPQAVYTLSQAVGAYQANQVLNFRSVASYEPATGSLMSYDLTDDGSYLVMVASGGEVTVYDLSEDEQTAVISSRELYGDTANLVTDLDGESFLLTSTYLNDAARIRYSDGAILWHQKYDKKGLLSANRPFPVRDGEKADVLIAAEEELIWVDGENGDIRRFLDVAEFSGYLDVPGPRNPLK